jgi:rubrerythrin
MESQDLIKNLKIALKNEEESANLYRAVAQDAGNHEIKNFFMNMESEERMHYQDLMKYYHRLVGNMSLDDVSLNSKDYLKNFKAIFSEDFLTEISSKQSILTAIKTAATKEKNASEFYENCVNFTDDENLKSFFHLLSKWEEGHLENILQIFERIDT